MPVEIGWGEIALRLALTVVAGAVIGMNRTERGCAAGLRTTILVCLAASLAMIQMNLLMPTRGKSSDSFVVFDLMRLPLGILTGIGFIGGGAILRRGDRIQGVTTAATLWLVTVIGLCLGGGQLAVGMISVALALFVLWGLRWLELLLSRDRRATLMLSTVSEGPTEEEVRTSLLTAGYAIYSWDVSHKKRGQTERRRLRCEVHWYGRPDAMTTPAFLDVFKNQPGVLALRWRE